jgi:adenine phosphoribosyltransferase
MENSLKAAQSLIREIPDYPLPGIRFQDLTPLLANGSAFSSVIEALKPMASQCDAVAGIEARGFIFASALAQSLGLGFVPIRKAGKLPFHTFEEGYGLEYGSDVLQIHQDALEIGERVLLLDDVLATGGTAIAASKLVERLGASLQGFAFVIEIGALEGRNNVTNAFPSLPLTSLFTL